MDKICDVCKVCLFFHCPLKWLHIKGGVNYKSIWVWKHLQSGSKSNIRHVTIMWAEAFCQIWNVFARIVYLKVVFRFGPHYISFFFSSQLCFQMCLQGYFFPNLCCINLREGSRKKNRKKFSDLLNPPRTLPPPGLVFFPNKKFTLIFFVETCIYNGRNEFYTWSHFKNK